jgi:adenylate kinase family enzyme
MRRVLVIGPGGAGKSAFAAQLARRTGLPLTHLDALYWQPGWVPMAPADWVATVTGLIAGEAWILDGNFGGTLERRLAACDTAVFLDYPGWLCLGRALRRWWRYRGRARPDMPAECPEHLSAVYFHWIWSYRRAQRPRVWRYLAEAGPQVQVIRLRTPREAERFLAALPPAATRAAPTAGGTPE